jgi:hypothetical protein
MIGAGALLGIERAGAGALRASLAQNFELGGRQQAAPLLRTALDLERAGRRRVGLPARTAGDQGADGSGGAAEEGAFLMFMSSLSRWKVGRRSAPCKRVPIKAARRGGV